MIQLRLRLIDCPELKSARLTCLCRRLGVGEAVEISEAEVEVEVESVVGVDGSDTHTH